MEHVKVASSKTPILVLLAAGNSSRMGSPKGLLNYNGKPWVLEQISKYKHVNNPKVIIVLGNDIETYFEQINWFQKALNTYYEFNGVKVKIVHNKNTRSGSFSSLKLALSTIQLESEVLVHPIDVPLLDANNLNKLLEEKKIIVIPKCDAKNGHPVKLKPLFWNPLLNIDISSKYARLDYLIKEYNSDAVNYINVDNPLIYSNMNTLNDWNYFMKK